MLWHVVAMLWPCDSVRRDRRRQGSKPSGIEDVRDRSRQGSKPSWIEAVRDRRRQGSKTSGIEDVRDRRRQRAEPLPHIFDPDGLVPIVRSHATDENYNPTRERGHSNSHHPALVWMVNETDKLENIAKNETNLTLTPLAFLKCPPP